MSTIKYKCDTCKREIELVEFQQGLEVMSRCIITDGCRGNLFQIGRNQDAARGGFPPRVPGLIDYTPRRVLFNHTQTVPATQWFIEHNLGVAPAVQVLIEIAAESEQQLSDTSCSLRGTEGNTSLIEIVDFSVEITGPNTLTITFDNPVSGLAQMIARSSAPKLSEPTVEEEVPVFQLTTGSLLTIATLNTAFDPAASITFDITYTPPGSLTSIVKTYVSGTTPSPQSPWNDFTEVLIQGKRYLIRSFNVFVSEMSDGTIPDGSSFFISQVGSQSPNIRETFIMLALSPYANVDKITNQIIDVSRINATNAELSLFVRDREMFAFTPIISSTFPPIREVG